MRIHLRWGLWLVLGLVWAGQGRAGDLPKNVVADKEELPPPDKKEDGLHWQFKGTANISFSHNHAVVGQTDGVNFSLGAALNTNLDYYDGPHLWLNNALFEIQETKTPTLDPWVKTLDRFEIKSAYLYKVPSVPWLGPFGAFSLKTSVFPGQIAQANETNYIIKELDGQLRYGTIKKQGTFELTSAFAPMRLGQSAGVFALPIDQKELRAEFRLGVGFREAFVQDGLAVADDATTPELEINRLEDYVVTGGELSANLSGLWREFLTYSLGVDVMYPFWLSIHTPLSGADKFHVDVQAKLGVKIFAWASLEYSLSVMREPFLVNDWQVQNGIVLSLGASVSGVKKFGPQPASAQ